MTAQAFGMIHDLILPEIYQLPFIYMFMLLGLPYQMLGLVGV